MIQIQYHTVFVLLHSRIHKQTFQQSRPSIKNSIQQTQQERTHDRLPSLCRLIEKSESKLCPYAAPTHDKRESKLCAQFLDTFGSCEGSACCYGLHAWGCHSSCGTFAWRMLRITPHPLWGPCFLEASWVTGGREFGGALCALPSSHVPAPRGRA